jgi:hypothetical protein
MLNQEMNKLKLSKIKKFESYVYEGIFWVSEKNIPKVEDICKTLNSKGII